MIGALSPPFPKCLCVFRTMALFSLAQHPRHMKIAMLLLLMIKAEQLIQAKDLVNTCDDGSRNGDETGVDCGGSCDACEPLCTLPLGTLSDIATCNSGNSGCTKTQLGQSTLSCSTGFRGTPSPTTGLVQCDPSQSTEFTLTSACQESSGKKKKSCGTCSDGIKNCNETGVDCGGSCDACEPLCTLPLGTLSDVATCNSGNSGCTKTQLGQSTLSCSTGFRGTPSPTTGLVQCDPSQSTEFTLTSACQESSGKKKKSCGTCSDGIKNCNETGVDCGGSCDACEPLCTLPLGTLSDVATCNSGNSGCTKTQLEQSTLNCSTGFRGTPSPTTGLVQCDPSQSTEFTLTSACATTATSVNKTDLIQKVADLKALVGNKQFRYKPGELPSAAFHTKTAVFLAAASAVSFWDAASDPLPPVTIGSRKYEIADWGGSKVARAQIITGAPEDSIRDVGRLLTLHPTYPPASHAMHVLRWDAAGNKITNVSLTFKMSLDDCSSAGSEIWRYPDDSSTGFEIVAEGGSQTSCGSCCYTITAVRTSSFVAYGITNATNATLTATPTATPAPKATPLPTPTPTPTPSPTEEALPTPSLSPSASPSTSALMLGHSPGVSPSPGIQLYSTSELILFINETWSIQFQYEFEVAVAHAAGIHPDQVRVLSHVATTARASKFRPLSGDVTFIQHTFTSQAQARTAITTLQTAVERGDLADSGIPQQTLQVGTCSSSGQECVDLTSDIFGSDETSKLWIVAVVVGSVLTCVGIVAIGLLLCITASARRAAADDDISVEPYTPDIKSVDGPLAAKSSQPQPIEGAPLQPQDRQLPDQLDSSVPYGQQPAFDSQYNSQVQFAAATEDWVQSGMQTGHAHWGTQQYDRMSRAAAQPWAVDALPNANAPAPMLSPQGPQPPVASIGSQQIYANPMLEWGADVPFI